MRFFLFFIHFNIIFQNLSLFFQMNFQIIIHCYCCNGNPCCQHGNCRSCRPDSLSSPYYLFLTGNPNHIICSLDSLIYAFRNGYLFPHFFLYFFIKFFLHLHYPLCILGSIQYMCSNCFLPLESLDFTVFTSNSKICAISRILNPSP